MSTATMSVEHGVVESGVTLETDDDSLRVSSDIVSDVGVAVINCRRTVDEKPMAATTCPAVGGPNDDHAHDNKPSSDINSLGKARLTNRSAATGSRDFSQPCADPATRTPTNGQQQRQQQHAHSSSSTSSSSSAAASSPSSVPPLSKQLDSNQLEEQVLRNERRPQAVRYAASDGAQRPPPPRPASEHADQEPDQMRPASDSNDGAPNCDINKRQPDAARLDECSERLTNTEVANTRLTTTTTTESSSSLLFHDRDREMAKLDENEREQGEEGEQEPERVTIKSDQFKVRCWSLTTAPSYEQISKRMDANVDAQEDKFKLPIASTTKFPNPTLTNKTKTTTETTSKTTKDSGAGENMDIDMATDTSPSVQRRVPQRKASVFSYDGFLGLHKLDPKTLQQHAILSGSSSDLILPNQDRAIEKSQSEEIVIMQQKKHQQQAQQQQVNMIATASAATTATSAAATSKIGEDLSTNPKSATAIGGSVTAPRRSNRSDTLGSTGSSRASSCDEPTILSPKLKAGGQLKLDSDTRTIVAARKCSSQASTTDSAISSLDSISGDSATAGTPRDDAQSEDVAMKIDDQPSGQDKAVAAASKQTDDSSPSAPASMNVDAAIKSAGDDSEGPYASDRPVKDVFSSASINCSRSKRHIPPPFESIKTQIKRNSVPDANFIKQHIDRLISHNEAIIENWNQISIRSYNSQAPSTAVAPVSAPTTSTNLANSSATSVSLFKSNNKSTTIDDKNSLLSGNKGVSSSGGPSATKQTLQTKRPTKRWSTTAIGNGVVFGQQQSASHLQFAPTSSRDKQSTTSGLFDSPPTVASELNHLVEARLRKRSYNNQHTAKRHSLRQSVLNDSCLNSILLSPTVTNRTTPTTTKTTTTTTTTATSTLSPTASALAKAKHPNDSIEEDQYQHASQFLFGPLSANSTANYLNATSLPSSVPSSPKPPANSFIDIQNFLNQRLDMAGAAGGGPKHLADHGADLNQLACSNFSQSIENAIKNLSLKRREEQQQQQQQQQQQFIQQQLSCAMRQDSHNHNQNLLLNSALLLQKPDHQCNDIVMATILMERQRQQQLLEDHICQQQQQHALEQQFSLKRLADLERECQQQSSASLMATSMQQQRPITTEQSQQLLEQIGRLSERQAHESQMLNEFLARLMLNRDNHNTSTTITANNNHHHHHHHQQQQQQHPLMHQTDLMHQAQQQPIIGHANMSDQQQHQQHQHPSDMFTQPLDSATPPHRCNACDVSFWTRDLLNYHLMTSCSARTGPEPNAPIAFNFNHPNGFDRLLSPTNGHHSSHAEPNWQHELLRDSHLIVPSELASRQLGALAHHQFGPLPLAHAKSQSINLDLMSQQEQQQRQLIASFQLENQKGNHLNVVRNGPHSEVVHSKSASPPRRRTYNELDAPHEPIQLQAPPNQAFKRDQQQQQQQTTSSHDFRNREHKPTPLVAPNSPHKTRESAELTWQQRLNELCILKQQLLTVPTQQQQQQQIHQHKQQTSEHESSLPIKKRKISEPNMRY